MKVDVFFKEYHLGKLTFENDFYIYNSNLTGEKSFQENMVSSLFYGLFNSNNLKIEKLPEFLQNYLNFKDNEFICEQAKINASDTDFEKLYKLSFLKFDDIGYYIGQKEKESC